MSEKVGRDQGEISSRRYMPDGQKTKCLSESEGSDFEVNPSADWEPVKPIHDVYTHSFIHQ